MGGRLVVVPMPADEGADRRLGMGLNWFFLQRQRFDSRLCVFFWMCLFGSTDEREQSVCCPVAGRAARLNRAGHAAAHPSHDLARD